MTTAVATPVKTTDPRLAAFVDSRGPEIFSGIVHDNQINTPDPFDVDAIHAEAREAFRRLADRAAGNPPPPFGKSLLLLGEAGSGKTHLLRAFRNDVHGRGVGYCGYMQLVSRSNNYARYILSKLIDSLDQPYLPGQASGLNRLARGLLDALDVVVPAEERERFCNDFELQPPDLAPIINRFADLAIQLDQFKHADLDVIRALLWLIPGDARIRPRVLKWLRCEDLSTYDRDMIGGLVPRTRDEDPLHTVTGIGKLMASLGSGLAIFVDQIEEILTLGENGEPTSDLFRRCVNSLIDILDHVPTAYAVVSCLEDFFDLFRGRLTKARLDRLEQDPRPIKLTSQRTSSEIEEMVRRRLEFLYDSAGVASGAANPLFPFHAVDLQPLAKLRPRDILAELREHHEQCIRIGDWTRPKFSENEDKNVVVKVDVQRDQLWNDHHTGFTFQKPDDEDRLAEVLCQSLRSALDELPADVRLDIETDGCYVPTELHFADQSHEKLLIAVCEKSARGGGLQKQVEDAKKRAGEIPIVFVRSTAFPAGATAKVSQLLLPLIVPKGKGRRVVVEDSEWRAMAAFAEFRGKHAVADDFKSWQQASKPLTQLPAIKKILDLDKLLARRPTPPVEQVPAAKSMEPVKAVVEKPKVQAPPAASQPLKLGVSRGATAQPVTLTSQELTYHMAFLGGTGSGKTTAALSLIEQLLVQGVPAVLIDRKGDLARYADPEAWLSQPGDERAGLRKALKDRIDVALFTPGASQGRRLAIPIAPPDLAHLSAADREQFAGYAASSLWAMMGNRTKGQDPKLAILGRAIDVLARLPGKEVSLRSLRQLVADQDDALLSEVEGFESKHFVKLGEMLQTLSIQYRRLFEDGDPLNIDSLLGRDLPAGKTRLAVINTQFLGDAAVVDFWMAQFLTAVGRWVAKNPSPTLQTVFLFDEADKYLPAQSQPAAKGPMDHLLRRARSAGIGLFLATQSPGDFDYKCRDQIRTWLIGRVREQTAIGKLKSMLEARPDAAGKLPNQKAGEFYLVREKEVAAVQTAPSLISTCQVPEDRICELSRTPRC